MSLHEGHRERLRERIKKTGFEGFQQHEILEYVLFHFIPRKDTNAIAHELINKFGSLSGVLNAGYESIKTVKGVTENAAIFLSLMPELFRKYEQSFNSQKITLNTKDKAVEYLKDYFLCKPNEAVYALALDKNFRLLNICKINEGWADGVHIASREVVDIAMRMHASYIILAHNHPAGTGTPSSADLSATNAIACALSLVGVTLIDHIIFARDDYFSFDEYNIFPQIDKSIKKFLKEGLKNYDPTDFS